MKSDAPAIERPTAALDAMIRELGAQARMESDYGAYLKEHGVEGEDLDAMLEVGTERMLVYRQLVHNRIRNATRSFIGRTFARLGKERCRRDVATFMDDRAPRSPYLRDVPAEFVEWACPRWEADPEVPDYIPDLARHELLSIDVRNDWRGGEEPTGVALALDRPLRFDGAARLVQYSHAVHRLPKSTEDRTEPEAEETRLLVYRDAEHDPRYLSLTPFAAALLEALMNDGLAVQPALQAACESLGQVLDDAALGSAAQLFADLGERGVCLGAEPSA
ncbi:MAG: putative DNA-binding domain-containing protein [Myxococcota bacterium]